MSFSLTPRGELYHWMWLKIQPSDCHVGKCRVMIPYSCRLINPFLADQWCTLVKWPVLYPDKTYSFWIVDQPIIHSNQHVSSRRVACHPPIKDLDVGSKHSKWVHDCQQCCWTTILQCFVLRYQDRM